MHRSRNKLYICRMTVRQHSPQERVNLFFASLAEPAMLLELFDQLPGIYMYVKDLESRFIRANRVVCDVVGASDPTELIGRTDFDYFPPAIAAQYVAEDQRVIVSGQPLYNQVWLVPGSKGMPRLYLCNKLPLFDHNHEVVGIAGVKRPYEHNEDDSAGFSRLMSVVAFVSKHYMREIEVSDLAEYVNLSVSQLQREFSTHFGITPIRYIREVRIGVARHLLSTSDASLSQIAVDCGFYDQSHFIRHFKSSTGLTPRKYRLRYGAG